MADLLSVEQDDSDVVEIIPAEDYNPQRAKLKASISWILTKAYGTNMPVQVKDPFYENVKGQLQVKPQLMNLMTTSDLYCQACSNMFSDTSSQWNGHWSIIQVLSRKGIRVVEAGEAVVTETVLTHTAPFRVGAHVALIEALMKAYTSEIASVEKVVQAVRHHSTVGSTLPSSIEEAVVWWVNKTCAALLATGDSQLIQGAGRKKLESVSRTTPSDPKNAYPKIADLMNDLGDGSCVAATISFYQPDIFPITDVCLKEPMGIADSLYNLRLVQAFCHSCLALKCFHVTYEDLLYGRRDLHANMLVFLAELFFLLEDLQAKCGAKEEAGEESDRQWARRPASPPTGRQSFRVAKRGCHRRAGETTVLGSSPRSKEGGGLLQNVSMSWDDASVADSTDVDPVTSADLARLEAPTVRSASSPPKVMSSQEQLLPAQLRTSKEKGPQQSKAEELGDHSHKHRMAAESRLMRGRVAMPRTLPHPRLSSGGFESGTSPPTSGTSPPAAGVSRRSEASAPSQQPVGQSTASGSQPHSIPEDSGRDSSSSLPTSRVAGGTAVHGYTSAAGHAMSWDTHPADQHAMGRSTSDLSTDREGSIASSRSSGDFSDHESHKIHQDHKAKESLKHSRPQATEPQRPRPQATEPQRPRPQASTRTPSLSLSEDSSPQQDQHTTIPTAGEAQRTVSESQAAMRGEENVGVAQGQEASEGGSSQAHQASPRSSSLHRSDSGSKKTTFARLPTETTWQERAQRSATQGAPSSSRPGSEHCSSNGGERPPVSELSQLRLRLEEKRREIERKKQQQEVQSARMRQRLGKAAFLRVVSKKEDGGGTAGVVSRQPAWARRNGDVSTSASQASLHDRLGLLGSEEPSARPTTLLTSSASSSNSTSASQSPSSCCSAARPPFTREGIQQTIDSVRRRWFHGSDPEGEVIYADDQTDDAGGVPVNQLSFDMMQSCPPDMASAMFGYSPAVPESDDAEDQGHSESGSAAASYSNHRESSQSPRRTPEKRVSWAENKKQKDYDDSLNKLNQSLTDLQGEIKRLTLQQQDIFPPASQSLEEHPSESAAPVQQASHQPPPSSVSPGRSQVQHHYEPPAPALPPQAFPSAHVPRTVEESLPRSSPPRARSQVLAPPPPPHGPHGDALEEEESSSDGFFVSFGDESTPRRPKPQLGTSRDSGGLRKDVASAAAAAVSVSAGHREGPQEALRIQGKMAAAVALADSDSGSSSSGSYHSLPGVEGGAEVIDSAARQKVILQAEMQRKRERLMQQQQKRQEELERKRMLKDLEVQRQRQKKMMKEEELEKKKAEEKARREAIFQQYIRKKLEEEEKPSPASTHVNRRDHSSGGRRDHSVNRRDHSSHGQPRPKSMFAKARPLPCDLEEPGSRGMSSHSSQEDLSSHSSPMGSTACLPSVRFNPNFKGKLPRAVSCDQLKQNGDEGPLTARRPPSPGTKLYVKPSAKSNRHIIINALSYCCLAGIVNTDLKNKVLEEIAKSTAKHFLILFRDHGCQYRSLFSFDPDTEEAVKIMGVGPRQLSSQMVERFYKYNSGGKSFNEVTSTNHLSVSIDAVVLKNVYWKTKVISAAKR